LIVLCNLSKDEISIASSPNALSYRDNRLHSVQIPASVFTDSSSTCKASKIKTIEKWYRQFWHWILFDGGNWWLYRIKFRINEVYRTCTWRYGDSIFGEITQDY